MPPIATHKGHLLARREQEVHPVEHLQVAIGFSEVLCLHHYLATVRSRRKAEMDALGAHLVHLDSFHLIQHLDARLHLLGLGGLIAEPLDERLDLRHLSLLGGELGHLRGTALLHLYDIIRVGAFVVVDTTGRNLYGTGGDVVRFEMQRLFQLLRR